MSKITNSLNCAVIFPTFCVFQDLTTRKVIRVGEIRDRLYHSVHPPVVDAMNSLSTTISAEIWHKRLGHPSRNKSSIFKLNNVETPCSISFCDICTIAKQSRLPFHFDSNRCDIPFELIHCDIWGPYATASHSGAHYFLTIVDDCYVVLGLI